MKAVFEKVNIEEGTSITAFRVDADQFEVPWHFHPELELTYIQAGTGMRYVGNHISDFGPGDLILTGPDLPHCWINSDTGEGPSSAIVVQWYAGLFDHTPEFGAIRNLLGPAGRGLQFHADHLTRIRSKLMEMPKLDGFDRFWTLAGILKQLAGATAPSLLAGDTYAYDLTTSTNDRLQHIQDFVRREYRKKIRLGEVAAELHMTEQSFSRFFSRVMKRPFFVFLNEYRCNRASRLLLETDLQVAEIGYQCGYESLPFFYQQFKKYKGHSPLGFRKMYRQLS